MWASRVRVPDGLRIFFFQDMVMTFEIVYLNMTSYKLENFDVMLEFKGDFFHKFSIFETVDNLLSILH